MGMCIRNSRVNKLHCHHRIQRCSHYLFRVVSLVSNLMTNPVVNHRNFQVEIRRNHLVLFLVHNQHDNHRDSQFQVHRQYRLDNHLLNRSVIRLVNLLDFQLFIHRSNLQIIRVRSRQFNQAHNHAIIHRNNRSPNHLTNHLEFLLLNHRIDHHLNLQHSHL